MTTLLEELLKDAQDITVTNEELSVISALASDQLAWEKRVKDIEIELETAKETLSA